MRRRKVLMIAPTSFFSDYGGHIRILEETLALRKLNNEITIVTYYKGRDLPEIDIRRTAPLPYHTDYEVGSSRHKLAFDVYLAYKTWQVAWRERPDIIHAHMHEGALIGAVVAKLLGVPLLFDFQGGLTAEMVDHNFLRRDGKLYWLVHRLERFINHRPQAILTSSSRARAILEDEFAVPSERIYPLPDCVDLSRFAVGEVNREEQAAVREAFGIPPGRFVVAYLGLLTAYQGIPDLLEAAALLKEMGELVHFLIMGFPNVTYYTQLATQLGVLDCVTLTGKIPYPQAPLYLSLGDAAVSAKVSLTEGSGKLLNYMALGLPVVAYDTAVHREYLGEYGVYVPPKDVAGLAGAIRELAHQPEEQKRLGRALYQRVREKYTWVQAAQKIDKIYENMKT